MGGTTTTEWRQKNEERTMGGTLSVPGREGKRSIRTRRACSSREGMNQSVGAQGGTRRRKLPADGESKRRKDGGELILTKK